MVLPLYFVAGKFIILIKPEQTQKRCVIFLNMAACNIAIPAYSLDANMRKSLG